MWHKLKVETVYIGGGTPTVLNETQLYLLIQSIYDCFDVMPGAEFTIEANPGTLTKSKLNTLKEAWSQPLKHWPTSLSR